jgi:hypothetical protein
VADDHDHDHSDHDHDHSHHDHDDRAHEDEAEDVSGWAASASTATCPVCGASGALSLGGGLFCPTCGEVSTNPGFQPPPES